MNRFLIKFLIPIFLFSFNSYSFEAASKSESDDYLLLSNIQKYNEAQQRDELASKITNEVARQIREAKSGMPANLDHLVQSHSAQDHSVQDHSAQDHSARGDIVKPDIKPNNAVVDKKICIDPDEFLNQIFDSEELNGYVNVKAKKSPVQEVISLIAKLAGLDLIIDEDVKGQCGNLSFNNKSAGEILQYICAHNQPQLCLIKDMNIWRVLLRSKAQEYFKTLSQKKLKKITTKKEPKKEPKKTKKKKHKYNQHAMDIKHAELTKDFKKNAEKAWNTIVGQDPSAMLTIDETTKKVFIRGKSKHVEEFKNFLDNIDLGQLRVKIDIAILIVDKSYGLDFGINWSGIYNRQSSIIKENKPFGFIGLGGEVTDFPTPTSSNVPNNSKLLVDPRNFTINIFNNAFTDILTTFVKLPLVFGGPDLNLRRLNLLLNATEKQSNSKVVSKPSMLITNNQVGKILVGQSLPIYTTVQDVVQSSVRSLSTINYKDVGISLQVKPSVSRDKRYINTNIFIEVSEVISGSTNTNPQGINENPPVILLIKHKNNVLLENGQTVVIGGILAERDRELTNQVPYLSKVPLIGSLFKAKLKDKQDEERIIFITPTIIE